MSDFPVSDFQPNAPFSPPLTLLFVCTGNAGRSQLAQAFARRALAGRAEVLSAGVAPWPRLHPVAVEILSDEGFTMEGHSPKSVDHYRDRKLDVVVTIGDPARRLLPASLRATRYYFHWDIADPAEEPPLQVPAAFRRASVTIQRQLDVLLAELRKGGCLTP